MSENKQTGVLILALGNPYYGSVAANLIMSLRSSDANLPIHLVYHGDALKNVSQGVLDMVTSMQECPEHCYRKDGKTRYFKAKTFIYDLSPFDNTVFLDVDLIWFQRPLMELVLNELMDVDFTIQNRDKYDLSNGHNPKYFWANYKDVKEKYKGFENHYLYSLHSEFIWFKRSDANKAFFDKVKEFYDNPPVPATKFAGDVADELPFAMACIECNFKPHKTPFVPVCWSQLDTKATYDIHKLKQNYYGYSVGGNAINSNMNAVYNTMAGSYGNHFNLPVYKLDNSKRKRVLMPLDRMKM